MNIILIRFYHNDICFSSYFAHLRHFENFVAKHTVLSYIYEEKHCVRKDMREIDIDNWKRKGTFERFASYTNPIFSVSTRLDVTKLYKKCKNDGLSFFVTFLYVATKCLNTIEEFRYRIKNGRVVLYDVIHPNYIVLDNDGIITSCSTEMADFRTFHARALADISAARIGGDRSLGGRTTNDVYYVSAMKWADLTSMSNPYDLNDKDSTSIPRLTWGKFSDNDDKKDMFFDIAAHHGLLDGEHACRGFVKIQQAIDNIDEFLK